MTSNIKRGLRRGDKSLRGRKEFEDEVNRHRGLKFQQVVVQTLLKNKENEEETSEEEENEEIEIPEKIGISLNLSRKNIRELPMELLDTMEKVQYLYLEGNKLAELPIHFFQSLPCLKWLDLRNNLLVSLPTYGLKNHPRLEVVLLQGNRIRNLPTELAWIPSLKGLQTSGNPITNVPHEAVAEGFRGIINHLRKLHSQTEGMQPVSETILKPSTSRDNVTHELFSEPTDSELRSWDLEKLSQWRQFMKKKSRKLDVWKECDNDKGQPRISVSVRSQPKIPAKPVPFRCGIYNRNRRRMTTAAWHRFKLRNTRLGYKRKPITSATVLEKARKEAYKARIRETLEKQARKIQRMRDKEVLKSWREHSRLTREQMKLLDNFQEYPRKDFAQKSPFDTDPDFLKMLNRVDIYRSLRDVDNRSSRKNRVPRPRISALDLERQMAEIMAKLQKLDTSEEEERQKGELFLQQRVTEEEEGEEKSLSTKKSHICKKMSQILDIQKTLKQLTALNSSMSGLMPLVEKKKKN